MGKLMIKMTIGIGAGILSTSINTAIFSLFLGGLAVTIMNLLDKE